MYMYMPRRCPKGTICIENMTFIFLIVLTTLAIMYYLNNQRYKTAAANIVIQKTAAPPAPPMPRFIGHPSVLLNPYAPPLRDTSFFRSSFGIPINVKTRGLNTAYRQVGILTRINGAETILPIMGRPLHVNRNKWQYYTMSDKNNSVKLPISLKGKSCTNEYGCDCLFNGDSVYVEGYNDAFKVTMYDNDSPQYIPFL